MTSEAPQGVKIIAYLFFAAAVIYVCGMCGALGGIFAGELDEEFMPLLGVLACVSLVFGILYAVIGYGLLNMQSWSRIAAIILAILALCNFPLGTIIGAIVLYFMFQEETQQAFS
jgi:hypothetical protein